jgi:GTP cyclohydrolase IA
MKQKEIMLNTPLKKLSVADDEHVGSAVETPLRDDAFELSDEAKIEQIAHHFKGIMETLGLDLTDDSLSGTPLRVAKMYINEVFSGLDPENKPAATLFENKFKYDQMVVEKEITFFSHCEHHFVPFYGKAHVAYISTGKVIGLSKINRIVQYFARRPQVQERLTMQVGKQMMEYLNTEDVAVVMDANHLCVSSRGVGDVNSKTGTAFFNGKFKDDITKREFLNYINTP